MHRSEQYVSLKVCVQAEEESSLVLHAIKVLKHLGHFAWKSEHGIEHVRLARDNFEIDGPGSGRHQCIAMKAEPCSVRTLQEGYEYGMLPEALVESVIYRVWLSGNTFQSKRDMVDGGMCCYLLGEHRSTTDLPIRR